MHVKRSWCKGDATQDASQEGLGAEVATATTHAQVGEV